MRALDRDKGNRGSTVTCASGRARTVSRTWTTLTDEVVRDRLDMDRETTRLTCFDSLADLRRLGQTTKVVKSTLNDVRTKIAELRAKTAESAESKQYDFKKRLQEIKELEDKSKEEQKEAKRRKKEEARKAAGDDQPADEAMMKMMGFGSFGGQAV